MRGEMWKIVLLLIEHFFIYSCAWFQEDILLMVWWGNIRECQHYYQIPLDGGKSKSKWV